MRKDYYKILGIPKTATTDDVKKAYRRLVHKCHPDIAGNTPENIQKFKDITEAYETLSSVQKREQYDSINRLYDYAEGKSEGKSEDKSRGKSESESKTEDKSKIKSEKQKSEYNKHYTEDNTKQSSERQTSEENYKNQRTEKRENTYSKMREEAKNKHAESIFSALIKRIVSYTTKKRKQKKYTPPKVDGKDITTEVTLSISEAINGAERVVNILHMETCDKCRGRKFINGSICPACNGKGEKSKYKKLTVKIPPQVKHNTKIRVEGEGNKGFNGGKRGNLYLIVKIENNASVEYDGLNVLRTIPIEPYEAVLGGYINFEMNGETIKMKLMPNTYNGQKYRISEQGVEKDGKKGDLIVTVKIDIPKNLSKEEVELYEKLKLLSKRSIREI